MSKKIEYLFICWKVLKKLIKSVLKHAKKTSNDNNTAKLISPSNNANAIFFEKINIMMVIMTVETSTTKEIE